MNQYWFICTESIANWFGALRTEINTYNIENHHFLQLPRALCSIVVIILPNEKNALDISCHPYAHSSHFIAVNNLLHVFSTNNEGM